MARNNEVMRLALLSDIHGNPIALEAVLHAARSEAVDGYIVLGDIAAGGYDPVTPIRHLVHLARDTNVWCVRGNADKALAEGWPGSGLEELQLNPSEVARQLGTAVGFAWDLGYLSAAGTEDIQWLQSLPLDQRLTLPDGTALLAVHQAPGHDGSQGRQYSITPDCTDQELRALLAGCGATLVCTGHIHWPLDRIVDGIRVINVGSVSNPWAPDVRASYVLLDADPGGYRLEYRRIPYDVDAVNEAIFRSGTPAAADLVAHFRGEVISPWGASASESGG